MERTVPEFPGIFKAKLEMPMSEEEAGVFRKALETDAPVCFDPSTEYVPPGPTREMFHIQSQIIIVIPVRVGKPWLLGMHQCSHPRVWNEHDRKLFTEISRRITDSLSSLLFFREVKRRETQLRNAQELTHVGSWELDLVHNKLDWNDETYHIFETDPQNFGATYEAFLQLVHPEDLNSVKQAYSDSLKNRTQYDIVHRLLLPDGRTKFVHERGKSFYNDEGLPVHSVGAVQDITDRKKAEEIIKASLKEKEALLQEIHHRVKNNMQVISSLLSLQSEHIKDRDALDAFRGSQNRIKSMALVHKKLYMTDDMSKINFIDYIESIARNLFHFYGVSRDRIGLNVARGRVFLNIETAIPCGLIINELVSNSLKYAFPDNRKGEINLALHSISENTFELTVSDNGIGIPDTLDIKSTKSLGLKLVDILTGQIRGKMQLIRENGTTFRIVFSEKINKRIWKNIKHEFLL
jgi:two-component system response regulator